MIYIGIRIITNNRFTKDEIENICKDINPKIKVIDSSKMNYKATHIYFKKDNYNFEWELQIWCKEDEKNNLLSHKNYKQDYIIWEKENKGGNT